MIPQYLTECVIYYLKTANFTSAYLALITSIFCYNLNMKKLIMWNVVTLDNCFEGEKPWDLSFHELVLGQELESKPLASGGVIMRYGVIIL